VSGFRIKNNVVLWAVQEGAVMSIEEDMLWFMVRQRRLLYV
jgi:hypothetical protein